MTTPTRAQIGFAIVVLLFLFVSLKPSSTDSLSINTFTSIPNSNSKSYPNPSLHPTTSPSSSSSSSSSSKKEKSKWTFSHLRPPFLSPSSVPNPSTPTIQQRLKLAELLWTRSVTDRHALLSQHYPGYIVSSPTTAPKSMTYFPCIDNPSYHATPFSIWDFLTASYTCPYEMERVGRMGDGGKWTCGMSRYEQLAPERECVVYSFGVQYESTFEEDLLKRTNCVILGYDYSVSKWGEQISQSFVDSGRAKFTQAGISGTTDRTRDPPFYSIQDLMSQNNHTLVDILKIDIEGAEYEALTSLIAFFAGKGEETPVGQIMIEIHLDPGGIQMAEFLRWWEESLEKHGWRPVWTEPNLLYVTLKLGDGMPRYAEYTLINVKDPRNILLQ